MIKVAVIDDHSVVRFGIRYMLQLDPEMSLVAEGESGDQALALVRKFKPDITLLDIRMPGVDGLAALQQIREALPQAKVIMLTTSDLEEDIYRTIRMGARGYLLKDMPPQEMVKAIRTVAEGKTYFPKEIQEQYELRSNSTDLSPRELEILGLIVKGLSNPDIARVLGISPNSVKMHLKHIFAKLDVQDRVEATTVALHRGILK